MNENEIPKESPEYNLGKIDIAPCVDEALKHHFKNNIKSIPEFKTITLSVMKHEDQEMECMSLISQIMSKYNFSRSYLIASWFMARFS